MSKNIMPLVALTLVLNKVGSDQNCRNGNSLNELARLWCEAAGNLTVEGFKFSEEEEEESELLDKWNFPLIGSRQGSEAKGGWLLDQIKRSGELQALLTKNKNFRCFNIDNKFGVKSKFPAHPKVEEMLSKLFGEAINFTPKKRGKKGFSWGIKTTPPKNGKVNFAHGAIQISFVIPQEIGRLIRNHYGLPSEGSIDQVNSLFKQLVAAMLAANGLLPEPTGVLNRSFAGEFMKLAKASGIEFMKSTEDFNGDEDDEDGEDGENATT